jgi:hypothetical protein
MQRSLHHLVRDQFPQNHGYLNWISMNEIMITNLRKEKQTDFKNLID